MGVIAYTEDESNEFDVHLQNKQYSTFTIANRLYGIDVKRVQEVVMPMNMTQVPLAPDCIRGLINLRGQVATAIYLRNLFAIEDSENYNFATAMNVVCRVEDNLISLLVDDIGDVVEVEKSKFEPTPNTISGNVRRFMSGVYKVTGSLLSIVEVDSIIDHLNNSAA